MSKNRNKALKAVEKINDQKILLAIVDSDALGCAREAAVTKLTDQDQIFDIALNNGFRHIQLAAIKALSGQDQLAQIVMNDWDGKIGKAALNEITCSATLSKLAKSAPNLRSFGPVLEKIIDQAVLLDIANSKDVKSERVCLEAAKRLSDQALAQKIILNIAANANQIELRKLAVENLSDQAGHQELIQKVLLDFVIASDFWSDCSVAFEKLTSQKAYAKVAINARNAKIREKAVNMLEDQGLLAEVAEQAWLDEVKLAAIAKLEHQSLLTEVVNKIAHGPTRRAVIVKLADQATLADIAKNDSDTWTRKTALKNLANQEALADIAKNDAEEEIREAAIEKLTDQHVLADIVRSEKRDGYICLLAASRLTDQTQAQKAYAYIAKHEAYPANVSKYQHTAYKPLLEAFAKLTDQALLSDVARNAWYSNIRVQAMEKCGLLCKKHAWLDTGQCRKKCTVCGVSSYDHNYKQTSYDGSGAEVSLERYTCTKCGHHGWASGAGSDLQEGYFFD